MADALARLDPREWLPLLYLALSLGVLAWNVLLAGRVARLRRAPRGVTRLSGAIGLLLAPAIVVAVAVASFDGARTVRGIAWLWPAVCALATVQAAWATGARLVSSLVGLPILAWDALLTVLAVADWLLATRGAAPTALVGLVAARDTVIGLFLGRAALASPLAIQLPLLVPAAPARGRASATVRAALVLTATAGTALVLLEWPRGVGAVRSYRAWSTAQLQERPGDRFAVGLRLLPVLGDAPKAAPLRNDLALVDSLAPDAVLLVLAPDVTRGGALDSIARVVERVRGDSTTLHVALALGPDEVAEVRARGDAGTARRIAALERITRRLRPDVVYPAWEPVMPGIRREAPLPLRWWRPYLVRAATTVHGIRPRTRVGLAVSRFDATDSTLHEWVHRPRLRDAGSVELVGLAIAPSFSGAPALDARLRAATRWVAALRATGRAPVPHWIGTVAGLPTAHGDESQAAALLHTLAWGTRTPWIEGAIVGDAGDYDEATGLRAADGRLRPAVRAVARAMRGFRERPGR